MTRCDRCGFILCKCDTSLMRCNVCGFILCTCLLLVVTEGVLSNARKVEEDAEGCEAEA